MNKDDVKTREVETPVNKHKLVIYAYMMGGEKEDLAAITDPKKIQKFLLRTLIFSIDGEKEVEKNGEEFNQLIRKMHGQDYDFVNLEMAKSMHDSNLDPDKKKDS